MADHPCGSQPAGDGGATVSEDVECDALIASRLAPTQGFVADHNCPVQPDPLWEPASLLAMAVQQSAKMLHVMPPSPAGWLPHRVLWPITTARFNPIPCGSQPAGDSGATVSEDVECDAPIASRLAPTLGFVDDH
ncbi:hypothetical protein EJA72_29965 [Pseudomonas sp. PB120]|nr:hypothetical protein [Pseudomonas sp. PB120]